MEPSGNVQRDSHLRTVAKALSWRALAVTTTTVVAYLLTGRLEFAIPIGLADSFTKLFLYYFHERTWENVKFGRVAEAVPHTAIGGD